MFLLYIYLDAAVDLLGKDRGKNKRKQSALSLSSGILGGAVLARLFDNP